MMWRSNWLRNSFERFFRSPKRPYRRRPERFFYRPRLDYLEDRTVLSTLNIPANPGILTFTAGANQGHLLSISLSGSNYTIMDIGGETITLTGAGTAAWTGNGTTSVTGPASSVTTMAFDLTVGGNNEVDVVSIANAISSLDGGPSGNNILIGPNNTASWSISGPNAGTLTGAGAAVTFANFQNLVGGTGDDQFTFSTAGASLAGTIDGGGGVNNTILGNNANHTWSITGANAGSVDVILPNGFTNVQNLIGGAGNDDFVFSGSGSAAGIGGGGGTNTIQGSDNNHTWNVTANNSGNVPGMISGFANIQNLTGGAGNDAFVFADGAGVTGTVDGGSGGTDSLDYSAYTTGVTVNLGAGTATGTGSVANIHQITGGQGNDSLIGNSSGTTVFVASPGNDGVDGGGSSATLVSTNAPNNFWSIVAPNMGTLNDGTNITTFTNVQNLVGGSGSDTLDFSMVAGAVAVTVTGAGTLDGVKGTASPTIATFDNMNILAGSTGSSLCGPDNTANAWVINALDAGTLNTIPFSGFSTLLGGGGTATNTFSFLTGGSVSIVNGRAGVTNTLDFGALNTVLTVTLNAGGSVSGFQGTSTLGITTSFDNVNRVIGTTNTGNSLTGANLPNTWTITAANAGMVASGANSLTFSNIQTINGGPGTDTLVRTNGTNTWNVTGPGSGNITGLIAFTGMENLTGGSGNDTFIFTGTGSVTGLVDGGGGSNTINLGGVNDTLTITVTGAGTTVGLQGTSNARFATFNNITNLIGTTSGANTLTAPNATNAWAITAANAGSLTTGGQSMSFSNIQNLTGGTGADTFTFTTAASSISGTIDGGGGVGVNTISGNDNNNTWAITGANAGGVAGMVNAFQNIQKLVGGSGFDILDFSAVGAVSVIVTGAGSIDGVMGTALPTIAMFDNMNSLVGGAGSSLCGPNVPNTWNVTGTNAGTLAFLTTTIAFSGFPNLLGGSSTDNFIFQTGGNVATIDGRVGNNTIQGDNANRTWNVTGVNAGNVPGLVGNFQNIQNLTGGTLNDTFIFTSTGAITGKVDGGPSTGTDTLDLSALNSLFNVTLLGLGTADGFKGTANARVGSFDNINVIIGTTNAGNSLTGANLTNLWALSGPNAGTLTSTNTLTFSNFPTLNGGPGIDTLVGTNANNTWNVTGPNAGTITGLIAFTGMENLTGGSGNDTFIFTGAGAISGLIDGGAGTDKLDLSALNVLFNVTLTALGLTDGFAGTANVRIGSFTNIDNIAGTTNAGNTLTGTSLTSSWFLTGPAAGTLTTGTNTLTFSNFPNIAGSGNDTLLGTNANNIWNITGPGSGNIAGLIAYSGMRNLTGGSMNDTFIFSGAGAIAGTIDGLAGANSLDFSALGDLLAVNLNGITANGFLGTVNVRLGSFTNINKIVGSTNPGNSLTRTVVIASSTWTLSGPGAGTLTTPPISLMFSNFPTINGPSAVVDTLVGTNANSTWNVTGSGSGNIVGIIAFTGMRNLTGGTGNDMFVFSGAGAIAGTVNGGGGNNTIAGNNNTNFWNITGVNAGGVAGMAPSFLNIQNLVGGTGTDVFVFSTPGSFLAGNIDGGSGRDALNYSSLSMAFNITLTGLGTQDGFQGMATFGIGGTFNNIDVIYGTTSGANTLRGANLTNTWALGGAGTGRLTSGANGLDFVNFPNLVGGPGIDTLVGTNANNIWYVTAANAGYIFGLLASFSGMENLTGGFGNDYFAFVNNATISGQVNGGPGGSDTLDLSTFTTPRLIQLVPATVHGFGGSDTGAPASVGSFDNIDTVFSPNGPGGNTLTGPNQDTIWNITGFNSGTLTSKGQTLTFSGFPNLRGGSFTDTFNFQPAGSLGGTIDGGPKGSSTGDSISWAAYAPRTVKMDAASGHGLSGRDISGNPSLAGFSDIDLVTGSNAGGNTLIGPDPGSLWVITGPNAGSFTSFTTAQESFTNFQNIVGGVSGSNVFTFQPGGTLVSLDGGGNGTVQWSGYGSDRNIALTGPGSRHGLAGTEPSLGRFDNVDTVFGNGVQTASMNTLTGDNNASTFLVTGDPNLGTTYTDNGNVLRLFNFQVFNGGASANTFNVFSSPAGITTTITGFTGSRPAGGNDTFNLGSDGIPADGRNLGGLQGPVVIHAGATDGQTVGVTCVGSVFATVPVGNQLTLNDQDDATAGLTYSLTENQFTRTVNQGGNAVNTIAPVTFTGIGYVLLNGGKGNDTYNVNLSPDEVLKVVGGQGANQLNFTNLNQLNNPRITPNTLSAPGFQTLCFEGITNIPQVSSLTATSTLTTDSSGQQQFILQLGNSIFVKGLQINIKPPAVVAAPSFASLFGFGAPSVAVGRVQGNLFPDLIVGLGTGFAPLVTVYDGVSIFTGGGSNPRIVAQFYAYASSFTGGVYVAAGNIFSTTQASIITGAGRGGGPHVEVFQLNGRYNSNAAPGGGVDLRRSFFAYPETPFFGGVRVATGHVHQAADGLDDIITGAGPGGGPHVRVFNGQGDGSISSVIRSFFAYAPNFFGGIFVAAGNYANHADGHVDILTGAGYGGGPHVRIFDSATLAEEASFFAFEPYIFSGVGSVAFAAPQIGSGNLDIFIGSGLGRPALVRRIAGTGSQPAFDANGNLIVTDTPLSAPAGQTLSGVGVFVGGFPFKQGS